MKYGVTFTMIVGLIIAAYFTAHSQVDQHADLKALHLNMKLSELEESFGSPFAKNRNQLTYILKDSSELVVTLRDEIVASAIVKFHRPLKIEDPEMRGLSLVQMDAGDMSGEHPSWFFAGKPEEGLIYKVSARGVVESLTWVPPFSYTSHSPKHLQALIKDFTSQNSSRL